MKNKTHVLNEGEMELDYLLMADCNITRDVQARLKRHFAGTVKQMLEVEMYNYLGYEKSSLVGNHSGNSRNGYGNKVISGEHGECVPKTIEKRQASTSDIKQKNMAMYTKEMTRRDIKDSIREIHGVGASLMLISCLIDKMLPTHSKDVSNMLSCPFLRWANNRCIYFDNG